MQTKGKTGTVAVLVVAGLTMLSACDGMFENGSAGPARSPRHTSYRAPTAKPEVTSPAAYKTCTETFKLEVGTPRYDKCIASLGELENENK